MPDGNRSPSEIEGLISDFRSSISTNLLARDDFIDWKAVNGRLAASSAQVAALQKFADLADFSPGALKNELKEHPTVYAVILDLLAFNSSGSQVEKWGLPQTDGLHSVDLEWVASQLLYVGLQEVLAGTPDVASLLRTAEVYKDSFRRRFRSAGKLDQRVSRLVTSALADANIALDAKVTSNANALPDQQLRRSLNYVLAVGNRPVAGIATSFQNQSGGRQQRDLSATYPALQQRLAERGMALILIADGQGLQEASERTLTALLEGVRFPMTLNSAADGKLSAAIVEASTGAAPETVDQAALNRLIEERLRSSLSVSSVDLPVSDTAAKLAIARFANGRRRADLTLSADGATLSWTKQEAVRAARSLKTFFDNTIAINLFTKLIGSSFDEIEPTPLFHATRVEAPPTQPFVEHLLVTASGAPLTAERAREIGRRSMEDAPGSMVAVYLTAVSLNDQEIRAHRGDQIFLPTNVVVISARLLEIMATDKMPLSRMMNVILAQSDLTKVSPFILSNATPRKMFYGREGEAATVLSTIPTNSVAILGSRRIGKTSLIRRLQDELSAAHFQPFFGDCQTVRTWSDFALLAQKQWGVELPVDFRPAQLHSLVDQLRAKAEGEVVIILDEIDQLIDWDQTHSDSSVPEAFFRTCRSISQEGLAQFVFAGERRIANRLWDPQSPHWNFCRDLQLAQLEQADAVSLLVQPLRAMNIEILEPSEFEQLAWERTSGHPQIVQFLGDRLVRLLDERENRIDLSLSPNEILEVTSTLEYAQHYVETYWGQATRFEKVISGLVTSSPIGVDQICSLLREKGESGDIAEVLSAIRMLQLYGIIVEVDGGVALRAAWFPDAMAHFGS